jgi:ABC-2 type transport system permease protein
MADLGSEPALRFAPAGGPFSRLALTQYSALAYMRLRMFANGFRTASGAVEFGARAASYLIYSSIGVGLGIGTGATTYLLAAHQHLHLLAIEFWVLLVLWQLISIVLASFLEQFDLSSLLRFPVNFGSFLLLHLVSGLVDVSTMAGCLACLGILIGMTLVRPDLLGVTLVALAGFAAFNILLVRAIFAWLDRWLARRRSREIVSAVFLLSMLGLQLLNPAIRNENWNPKEHAARAMTRRGEGSRAGSWLGTVLRVQAWLPGGLPAAAIESAADGSAAAETGSLGLLGLYALGAGGLLCIRLRAEYRGESLGEAPSSKEQVRRDEGWLLSGGGPISAQIEKELRVLLRSMTQIYAIGVPPIMVVIIASLFRNGASLAHRSVHVALPVCVAYGLLGFTQLIYNSLGAEGKGIQMLFLFPVSMRRILLAKNMFHGALYIGVAIVSGALATLRIGVPDPAIVAVTLAWLAFALPANLAAGNLLSVLMAYRVNLGRLGRQSGSQANALLSMLIQTSILGAGAGVVGLCAMFDRMWLAVPGLLALAVVAVGTWLLVLKNVDTLAYHRRDALIGKLARVE